jgi:hypothetical protein
MSVERWELNLSIGVLERADNGAWVAYSDYEDVRAEVVSMAVGYEELRAKLQASERDAELMRHFREIAHAHDCNCLTDVFVELVQLRTAAKAPLPTGDSDGPR